MTWDQDLPPVWTVRCPKHGWYGTGRYHRPTTCTIDGCAKPLERAVQNALQEPPPVIDAAEHQARQGLDDAMRAVLARLELISNGTTASWNPTNGSQTATVRPGQGHPEGLPAGDTEAPHLYWRRRYDDCATNAQRSKVIAEAEGDLKLLTGRYTRTTTVETPDETIQRMLKETAGWTPEEVEQSRWRMSARMVRKHRVTHGRDAETGKATSLTLDDDADWRDRAREMKAGGMTLRQIAFALGKHKTQVERAPGRAA